MRTLFSILAVFSFHAVALGENGFKLNTESIYSQLVYKSPGYQCSIYLNTGAEGAAHAIASIKEDGSIGLIVSKRFHRDYLSRETIRQFEVLAELFNESSIRGLRLVRPICRTDERTICFEFVEGESVDSIHSSKTLSPQIRESIFNQYLDALKELELKLISLYFRHLESVEVGSLDMGGLWKSKHLAFAIHPHNVYYNPKNKTFTIIDIDVADDSD